MNIFIIQSLIIFFCSLVLASEFGTRLKLLSNHGVDSDSTYFSSNVNNPAFPPSISYIRREFTSIQINNAAAQCPPSHLFYPCECNEVSFDGKEFHSQVSCRGVSEDAMRNAFTRAFEASQGLNVHLHALELKEHSMLTLSSPNLTSGFTFNVVKIADSRVGQLNEQALDSTANQVQELVFMDVLFANNLDDGQQLFSFVRRMSALRGLFIISTNLRSLPANALRDSQHSFGSQLHVLRICNSLLQKLYSGTFEQLRSIDWIDLADNRLHELEAASFRLHVSAQHSESELKISLSGNRLHEQSGQWQTELEQVKRPLRLFLEANRFQTLTANAFAGLVRSETDVKIALKENPLICDCEMAWLASEPNAQTRFTDVQCSGNAFSAYQPSTYQSCTVEQVDRLLLPNGDIHKKCCRQIPYRFRADELNGSLKDVASEKGQLQEIQQQTPDIIQQHTPAVIQQATRSNVQEAQEEIKHEKETDSDTTEPSISMPELNSKLRSAAYYLQKVQVETDPQKRLLESLAQQSESYSKTLKATRGYAISTAGFIKNPLAIRASALTTDSQEAQVRPLNSRRAAEISELASRSDSRPFEPTSVNTLNNDKESIRSVESGRSDESTEEEIGFQR